MLKLTERMDKHGLTGKNVSSVKGKCLADCWVRVPINTQRREGGTSHLFLQLPQLAARGHTAFCQGEWRFWPASPTRDSTLLSAVEPGHTPLHGSTSALLQALEHCFGLSPPGDFALSAQRRPAPGLRARKGPEPGPRRRREATEATGGLGGGGEPVPAAPPRPRRALPPRQVCASGRGAGELPPSRMRAAPAAGTSSTAPARSPLPSGKMAAGR